MPRKKIIRAGFTFFPNDWLSDTGLNACSLGARGLWIEMLARMFKSPKRGYLLMPNGESIDSSRLAILSHAPESDVTAFLSELKAQSIFSQTCTGTVYCRKMLRDIKERDEWRKRKSGQYDRAKRITQESTENHALSSPLHSFPIPNTNNKHTKRATAWPEGFTLTEDLKNFAVSHGIADPMEMWAHFEDHHRSKGNLFKEWDRAWRSWVRNSSRFKSQVQNGSAPDWRKGEYGIDLARIAAKTP